MNYADRLKRLEQHRPQVEERFVVVFYPDPDPEPAYPGERLRIVRIVPFPGEEAEGDGTTCDDTEHHHDATETAQGT